MLVLWPVDKLLPLRLIHIRVHSVGDEADEITTHEGQPVSYDLIDSFYQTPVAMCFS